MEPNLSDRHRRKAFVRHLLEREERLPSIAGVATLLIPLAKLLASAFLTLAGPSTQQLEEPLAILAMALVTGPVLLTMALIHPQSERASLLSGVSMALRWLGALVCVFGVFGMLGALTEGSPDKSPVTSAGTAAAGMVFYLGMRWMGSLAKDLEVGSSAA